MTKLKEMTFAVLAEKENSIAHNWFQQAFSQSINWIPGNWYIYNPKAGLPLTARKGECDCEIKWSEDQFESIFVEEEFGSSKQLDHYAKNMQFGGKTSIRENTQTFPKNTAFGTGNIAHEHVSSEKKITKDDVIPKERIRLAQYYLECMTKKLVPHFRFTEDYSDLKDKMAVDALVNNVYASIMNGKSVGNIDAKLQDAEKAIEIYKNDVDAKAKRIKALEDVVDDKCREVSSLVKRNIELSRDFAEKTESQEKIIKKLRQKVNGRDYKINKLE